jgi:putative endonuclease
MTNFAQDDKALGLMKEHRYFVYIVCSNSGTLYIGMTNDVYRRALQHKLGEVEGFAAKYGCKRLVHYESFDDVLKAIDREKQLKRWVRRKKIALIDSRNPRWADLAEKWGAEMRFANQSIET